MNTVLNITNRLESALMETGMQFCFLAYGVVMVNKHSIQSKVTNVSN